MPLEHIQYDDFLKVDMRIGRIVRVEDFPQARKPAYKLWIDFGPELGVLQSSAQVTRLYHKEDLEGRQVAAVVNFPHKRIAGFQSQALVLGADFREGEVALLVWDREMPLGSRIY